MNRFVISDIHGAYKALLQVLKSCNFRYDNDLLICLGDTCDRWPKTFECFEKLLKIRNLIYILGNHDKWLRIYAESSCSQIEPDWIRNGGLTTLKSYKNGKVPTTHVQLLSFAPLFFELDNICLSMQDFAITPIRLCRINIHCSGLETLWNMPTK